MSKVTIKLKIMELKMTTVVFLQRINSFFYNITL